MAFLPFALALGGFLACGAVSAAWLFRLSGAPLALKVILPAAMLALALYAPFAAQSMFGRPIAAAFADLPDRADLIAFYPHDEAHSVDLWLVVGGETRAYQVPLTKTTKKTLADAREALGKGRLVRLKKATKGDAKTTIIGDDDPGYILDDAAISRLPPKD